jgi:Cytochrome P450
MDPKTWNEPNKFKPERFLDEQGRVTGKEGIVSFSLGKFISNARLNGSASNNTSMLMEIHLEWTQKCESMHRSATSIVITWLQEEVLYSITWTTC